MAKHTDEVKSDATSGKWVVGKLIFRENGHEYIPIICGIRCMCRVANFDNGKGLKIAEQIVKDHNAAPALLEALEKSKELWKMAKPLLDGWDDSASQVRFTEYHKPIEKIEEAIAKAKEC